MLFNLAILFIGVTKLHHMQIPPPFGHLMCIGYNISLSVLLSNISVR